jgi:nicotinamide riboside transporter PnuC
MPVTEVLGLAVTAIAVAGVLLNNRLDRRCFALWLVSNGLSAGLHVQAAMWALAGRDVIFIALAVAGWQAWRRAAPQRTERRLRE